MREFHEAIHSLLDHAEVMQTELSKVSETCRNFWWWHQGEDFALVIVLSRSPQELNSMKLRGKLMVVGPFMLLWFSLCQAFQAKLSSLGISKSALNVFSNPYYCSPWFWIQFWYLDNWTLSSLYVWLRRKLLSLSLSWKKTPQMYMNAVFIQDGFSYKWQKLKSNWPKGNL